MTSAKPPSSPSESSAASSTQKVRYVEVDEFAAGQRIDNYLLKHLKGVPKSRIYKALRKGEVRINKSRAKPTQQLRLGDSVRLPPLRTSISSDVDDKTEQAHHALRGLDVLFEDHCMMVVNKPAGLAVHGGSGIEFGLIEAFRASGDYPFLELVHRLDRQTSGCLVLAKNRPSLLDLQQQISNKMKPGNPRHGAEKRYLALLEGQLKKNAQWVRLGLRSSSEQGHKRMVVDKDGQFAESHFVVKQRFEAATLSQITLHTGRMHQARAHANAIGHGIAGDDRYGHFGFNREMRKFGLKRLFLHAESLTIHHPEDNRVLALSAPLPPHLENVLAKLASA